METYPFPCIYKNADGTADAAYSSATYYRGIGSVEAAISWLVKKGAQPGEITIL